MHIKVRVIAGAKKELVERRGENLLIIHVREPAERNMANRRVRELVAREAKVALGRVRMILGHTSPAKMFSIAEQ